MQGRRSRAANRGRNEHNQGQVGLRLADVLRLAVIFRQLHSENCKGPRARQIVLERDLP